MLSFGKHVPNAATISILLVLITHVAPPSIEAAKRKKPTEVLENGDTTDSLSSQQSYSNAAASVVKIGSFNLKQFGSKKSGNEQVLKTIAKIVRRYDLIALQEITDVKEASMKKLIAAVNQESSTPYHFESSPRVGRTNQKEQYALMFRPDVFQVKRRIIFDDSLIGDAFSREPQISELILKQTGERFVIINVHIAPKNASTEIDSLVDVHTWVVDKWRIRNIVILGDLNAGCEYIRKKDIPNIRLLNNPTKYKWLISDSVDTTVGTTKCAYDRIITSGNFFKRSVVPNSPKAFQFDREYRLEPKEALSVSDHYPVEFSFYVANVGMLLNDEPQKIEMSSSGHLSQGYAKIQAIAIVMFNAFSRAFFGDADL